MYIRTQNIKLTRRKIKFHFLSTKLLLRTKMQNNCENWRKFFLSFDSFDKNRRTLIKRETFSRDQFLLHHDDNKSSLPVLSK